MCTPYPKRDPVDWDWLLDEPVEEQNRLAFDQVEEAARIERWCAFVTWLKGGLGRTTPSEWATLVWQMEQLMRGHQDPFWIHGSARVTILQFQREEGWSGVFSALARAMSEQGL